MEKITQIYIYFSSHERAILKWIFKKWRGMAWIDCFGSGQGYLAGFCEHGNEPLC